MYLTNSGIIPFAMSLLTLGTNACVVFTAQTKGVPAGSVNKPSTSWSWSGTLEDNGSKYCTLSGPQVSGHPNAYYPHGVNGQPVFDDDIYDGDKLTATNGFQELYCADVAEGGGTRSTVVAFRADGLVSYNYTEPGLTTGFSFQATVSSTVSSSTTTTSWWATTFCPEPTSTA